MTRPVVLSPDGQRLFALNAPDARLSVFDISNPTASPLLIAEIPVGLEPVSIGVRNQDEVWVVNELSDSVSVVSLKARSVIASIQVPDEPADIVFAQDKAFVSCARTNDIAVIELPSLEVTQRIPLEGLLPRALALSPSGDVLYAAFLFSGNNTTILNFREAPTQPAPDNPELPVAPKTALIVPDDDPRIDYDVLDHDIAVIATATGEVTDYIEGIGTNILSLTTTADSTLWAGHTEAKNLIRFEPQLKGIFSQSRVAFIQAGQTTLYDLNPFALEPTVSETDKARALAQPMALTPGDSGVWLAAYGSDRVAELSADGTILQTIDLRTGSQTGADHMRGPRGIVLGPQGRLYVHNKIANTISVVDVEAGTVVAEVPTGSYDPRPEAVRRGSAFFYDTRQSGNGTVSCGSCHIDADRDGLAWDLGDPGGELETVIGYNLSIGETDPEDRVMHPMKGPLVTQTLRGLRGQAPFHWRGDRQRIQDFNPTFEKLQAGSQLNEADIDAFAAYLESIEHHPNPNLNRDRTLPTMVAGGDPTRGRELFVHPNNLCSSCHTLPESTNHILDSFTSVLSTQPMKNASLRLAYQKNYFTPKTGTSLSGFGYGHDGAGPGLPRGHEYDIDVLDVIPNGEIDVTAFVLAMDTGTAPTVGYSVTLNGMITPTAEQMDAIALLESRDAAGDCELVIRGIWQGESHAFRYHSALDLYEPDASQFEALTLAGLMEGMLPSDSLSFLGAPLGQGERLSIDRNDNGLLNQEEPAPQLFVTQQNGTVLVVWPQNFPDWHLEASPDLSGVWSPVIEEPDRLYGGEQQALEIKPLPQFYRLQRNW